MTKAMAMPGVAVYILVWVGLVALSAVTQQDEWDIADATFYGDMSGNATMVAGGDCGYGDLFAQGYGLENTAVSGVLFNDYETCGACFEVRCFNDSLRCAPGSINVTVTSLCPPDPRLPGGGLCQPPRKHFDMSESMYVKIATSFHAGSIPIQFRRVSCVKTGGIKFQIKGNPWWILVLVYNVGGSGDVAALSIKGSGSGSESGIGASWTPMEREWGQNWQITKTPELVGQRLSFQVTTGNGKVVVSDNVAPADWQFGQIFEGAQFLY
ncbi:expansin-A2-like isoform X1 [Zingiber officinale]|uniref:expansin-A2-like isoform X1 n=1 Tax=Zingiber officinale TaxID=94328 RepID=UPI001C4BEF41|nr:expansin-A2-like isoform X1 [Zingiber officinale]